MNDHTFAEDWRKEKPGLHMLYTRWAVEHLTAIDRMLRTLAGFSNGNMLGPLEALSTARGELVRVNAAYYEADQILRTIAAAKRGKHYREATPGEISRGERFDPVALGSTPASAPEPPPGQR